MNINTLKSLVPDGAIFDEATKHILTEDGVEMKYCSRCNRWHPISFFYANSNAADGLGGWCKNCYKGRTQDTQGCVKASAAKTLNSFFDDLDISLSKVRVSLENKDAEIAKLKTEIETLRNKVAATTPTELSTRHIEEYLKSHYVPPRILLSAVARQDARYEFMVHDTITGITSTVKVDVN